MDLPIKFAFAGFRHGHIYSALRKVKEHADCQIVACCEEDAATREQLAEAGNVDITHNDYQAMLNEVDCDVVAIGDYYRKHGPMVIGALQAGKHVLCDKPLCIALEELDTIESLVREKGLCVSSMLDLRDAPPFVTLRQLVTEGKLGEVHTVSIFGQHALARGSRPQWYFEPGNQGGTINDIAVHGVDFVEWATGLKIVEIVAARAWNAGAKDVSHFQDGAQLMMRLENNGGFMSDVSYLAPTSGGEDQYWRTSFHGTLGVAETHYGATDVRFKDHDADGFESVPLVETGILTYFQSFLLACQGKPDAAGLSTDDILRATRITLMAQRAADQGQAHVACD